MRTGGEIQMEKLTVAICSFTKNPTTYVKRYGSEKVQI
jgi:hypothetical protein